MAVRLTQTCDGCGTVRYLKVSNTGRTRDIREAALSEGWCEARANSHLCPKCIDKVTSQKKHGL